MNKKNFAFIVCTNNEIHMSECRYYINMLHIPNGHTLEIIEITDATSMTSGYNQGMRMTDAAYKIYLHQDTFIINRNMLFELLHIFEDPDIGMIGLIGGEAYKDGYIHHYWNKGHALNATYEGLIDVDMREPEQSSQYIAVDAVDGLFIATQYDIEWDERLDKWHMYDIAQSIRFHNAGYKVCVLNIERTWALHDSGFCSEAGYDVARKQLSECYPEHFTYSPIKRQLLTDDMDTIYLSKLHDHIANLELSKYGVQSIPDNINDFNSLYTEIKFLVYRMSFGMPNNDWRRLTNFLLCKKISAAFLMEMISRYSTEPEIIASEFEAAITPGDNTVMFFDQYQRYHTAADLIKQAKEHFTLGIANILEIGANEHKNLGKELPLDSITYTDLRIPEIYIYDNRYIAANASNMPEIPNDSYDFCVALDVFEHIPSADRKSFISEIFRVSRYAAILCFPYNSPHVIKAEDKVNSFNRKINGEDNPWLIEHKEYGLPDRNSLEQHLKKEEISYFTFTHGGIDLWEKLTTLNTLIDTDDLNTAISDLNIYYNRNIYTNDSTGKDYRVFYVLNKKQAECHVPTGSNYSLSDPSFADLLYESVMQNYYPDTATRNASLLK